MLQKYTKHRFVQYGLVGVISFAVEYLTFVALNSGASINYVLANAVSVLFAFIVNFLLNQRFVFKQRSGLLSEQSKQQLKRYTVLVIVNGFASTLIIGLLIEFGMAANLAKLVAIGMVVTWTYLIYKKIIFTGETTDGSKQE